MAQLVEQLIRNQQVGGSSPPSSSTPSRTIKSSRRSFFLEKSSAHSRLRGVTNLFRVWLCTSWSVGIFFVNAFPQTTAQQVLRGCFCFIDIILCSPKYNTLSFYKAYRNGGKSPLAFSPCFRPRVFFGSPHKIFRLC